MRNTSSLEQRYYEAINKGEDAADLYKQIYATNIYENNNKLSSYSGWNQIYSSMMSILMDLEAKSNFVTKVIYKFDDIIALLDKLNILFHDYFKIPDYLHIDKKIIAKQIADICDDLEDFYIIKNTILLHKKLSGISCKIFPMLAMHERESESKAFVDNVKIQISKELHKVSLPNRECILKSETCKKHPEILMNVLLNVMEFTFDNREESIEILIKNGIDINVPIKWRHRQSTLLEIALDFKSETAVLRLLDLGAVVTEQACKSSIKCSINIMEIILDKFQEYKPDEVDYTELADSAQYYFSGYEYNNEIKEQSKQKMKLLCKLYPPTEAILIHALKKGNFPITLMLIQDYSLKLPEFLPCKTIQAIIDAHIVADLDTLNLKIPVHVLEENYYKNLSAEKIQYCITKGASVDKIQLNGPGVMGLPVLVSLLIDQIKKSLILVNRSDDFHKALQLIELKDEYGNRISLLHYAAIHGHAETVRLFILNGFDVNEKSALGRTPLHYAAAYNNTSAATVLIEEGANVNALDNELQTPLHKAVITGMATSVKNIPGAKILLQAGADQSAVDIHKKTPLQSLYKGGNTHEEVKRWNRTFKTISNPVWNFKEVKKNAQILAQGKRDANSYLFHVPVDVLYVIATLMGHNRNQIETNMNYFVIAQACFNSRPTQKLSYSLIHYVLNNAAFPVTSLLLRQYSIIITNQRKKMIINRLGAKCYRGYRNFFGKKSFLDVLDILYGCSLEELKGLDLPVPVDFLSQVDSHLTYMKNFQMLQSEKIQYCLDKGASINGIDILSEGVLGLPLLVRQLMEDDANTITPETKNDLLMYVIENNCHPDVVRYLIDKNFDVNALDQDQFTPLHIAVNRGDSEIIKILIEQGANVNALTHVRITPLHIAARENSFKNSEILLYAGANHTIRNIEGWTARNFFDRSRFIKSADRPKIEKLFEIIPDPEKKPELCDVRKNSRVISSAYRTHSSFFYALPVDVSIRICAMSGERRNEIRIDEKTYEVAKKSFSKI